MSESSQSDERVHNDKPKVWFCEQKKLYHYKKVSSPLESVEVSKGFVSTKYIYREKSFDNLIHQLLILVLNHHRELPFPKDDIISHIKKSFSLDDEELDTFLQNTKSIIRRDLVQDLENKLNQIGNKQNFYNKLSFKDNAELYSRWKRMRRKQLKHLIEEFKKDISEENESNTQESQLPNSNEYDSNSDNLSKEFTYYSNLFNIFISFDKLKLSHQHSSLYNKINSRMDKEYLISQIEDSELDDIQTIENLIDESDFQSLSFFSPISQYLLDIYSEYYGITLFNNQVVVLNYLLSNFKLHSDFPVAIIIYLSKFKSLLKTNKLIYNDPECEHIKSCFNSLRKEVIHFLNNIFRYFKPTDILDLSQILVILKLTDQIISLLAKEEVNDNWNKIFKEMVDQSIQNYYQDILLEAKDIVDPHCAEASNVTTSRKKKRINLITHSQLLKTITLIRKKIKIYSEYENLFSTISFSKKKVSFLFYQRLLKDVKHFMGSNDKRKFFGPIIDLLVSLKNYKDKMKINELNSSKIETLITKFMKFWLSDAEKFFLHKLSILIDEDDWKPLENNLNSDYKPLYSTSCMNIINTHVENLKYFKKLDGIIPKTNYNTMFTSYIKIVCLLLKKYSEELTIKIIKDYPNYLQLEIHDLICQEYGIPLLDSSHSSSKKRGSSKKAESLEKNQLEDQVDSSSKSAYNSLKSKKKHAFRITESMCIKINNIELTENKYNEFIAEIDQQNPSNINKLLDSHIQLVTSFIWKSLEHKISKLLNLSKKKLNKDIKLMDNIVCYLNEQTELMSKNLTPNIFKDVLSKMCNTFTESFSYYKDQGTAFQIQIVIDLIERFESELNSYGVVIDNYNFVLQNEMKKEDSSGKISIEE